MQMFDGSSVFRAEVGGRELILETGVLAQQAGGAVTARTDDTVVFASATMSREVREGTEYDLIDADFFLEMTVEQWQDLVTNTRENNGADLSHTLNTLDLMIEGGISDNATGDQLRADVFFRVNQSLQHFFDSSARLETVFE